jgi:capsular polysaccharide biosynthesis protein
VAASSVIVLILHIIVILGAGFISFILVDDTYHPHPIE